MTNNSKKTILTMIMTVPQQNLGEDLYSRISLSWKPIQNPHSLTVWSPLVTAVCSDQGSDHGFCQESCGCPSCIPPTEQCMGGTDMHQTNLLASLFQRNMESGSHK